MGIGSRIKNVFLGNNRETVSIGALQKSEKTTTDLERKKPKELEKLYMSDGIAFSAVNTIVQTFMSADYRVSTENDKEKAELNEILDNADFNTLLMRTIQDLCVFGNSYLEIVNNKAGDKIVDLEPIDSKQMEFLKDSKDNVIFENSHPKAYLQKLPLNYDTSDIKDSNLYTKNGKKYIKFDYDEILHLTLYNLSDNPKGVGVLEPLYNEFVVKKNIEQGLGESVYRKGYPRIVVELGDEEHPPQQEDIDDMKNKLKDLSAKDEFIVPYYYNMEYLESSKPEKMHVALEYAVDLIISGLGIPKAFITGIGSDVNRSSLDKQTLMFERYIGMLQNIVTNELKEKIFSRVAREREFSSVPTVDFDAVSTDDENDRAERLKKYAKSGLISPDENIENQLLKKENLDD